MTDRRKYRMILTRAQAETRDLHFCSEPVIISHLPSLGHDSLLGEQRPELNDLAFLSAFKLRFYKLSLGLFLTFISVFHWIKKFLFIFVLGSNRKI